VALGLTFTILLILRAPRYLLSYLPIAILFTILAPVPLLHRVTSIVDLTDASNYDRVCMAEAGLLMIRERPLFGLGPGVVRARYPLYRHPTAPRLLVPHLHNTYLQIAADAGLLSLGAYLWFMGAALGAYYRSYRIAVYRGGSEASEPGVIESAGSGPDADLLMGAFLALLAFNFAGFFEHNWGDTEVQRLALFAAAIPYCLRNEPRSDDPKGADLA
jgi:O-antigen ligase